MLHKSSRMPSWINSARPAGSDRTCSCGVQRYGWRLHLVGKTATIFRDAAGRSLHQRGWRMGEVEAPLSEVLAAGILATAGWQPGESLLDPMCGSGTLIIEAATIAAGIAPGLYRRAGKHMGSSSFETVIGRLSSGYWRSLNQTCTSRWEALRQAISIAERWKQLVPVQSRRVWPIQS